MCEALRQNRPEGSLTVHYLHLPAILHLEEAAGEFALTWGRREEEAGELPIGSGIPSTALKAGGLGRFRPRLVKLRVQAFCVTNREGRPGWHQVIRPYWILGVRLDAGAEERVYVVTTPSMDARESAWPWVEMIERLPLFIQ